MKRKKKEEKKEKLSKEDWLKTLRDFEFFCNKLLDIELNKAQKKVLKELFPLIKKKVFPLRFLILAGNQSGKTTLASLLILWFAYTKYCFFEHNLTSSDWRKLDYVIAITAPLRSLTRALFHTILKIINGKYLIAPKNKKEVYRFNNTKIKGFIYRYTKSEAEGFGMIPTMYCANGSRIEFFTMAGTKGDSLQGSSYNLIVYDELGRSDTLIEEIPDIYSRLQTTRGPFLALTTPSEKHSEAIQFIDEVLKKKDYHKFHIVHASSLDNEYKKIEDIYASVEGLSPWEKKQIIDGELVPPRASFFPPEVITEAFTPEISKSKVDGNMKYFMGIDTALINDRLGITIIDASSLPFKVVDWSYIRGKDKTVTEHKNDIEKYYLQYHPEVILEVSSEGAHLWMDVLSHLEPIPFRFGMEKGTSVNTKVDLLLILRRCLESRHLLIPNENYILKRQLIHYKLEDSKIETDAVMSLGLAVYFPYKEIIEGRKDLNLIQKW